MLNRFAAFLSRDTGSVLEDAIGTLALFVLLIAALALPSLA